MIGKTSQSNGLNLADSWEWQLLYEVDNYHSKLCSRGNSVKNGWHQQRLLHLNLNLTLN